MYVYVCKEQVSYVLVRTDQSLRCRLILHEMSSDFWYLILECSTNYYKVGTIYIYFIFCVLFCLFFEATHTPSGKKTMP